MSILPFYKKTTYASIDLIKILQILHLNSFPNCYVEKQNYWSANSFAQSRNINRKMWWDSVDSYRPIEQDQLPGQ